MYNISGNKFQTVAEKTAKNFRGYFILTHPVVCRKNKPILGNLGQLEAYGTFVNDEEAWT